MRFPRSSFARFIEPASVGVGLAGALVLLGHLACLWALPDSVDSPSPLGSLRYLEVPFAWVPGLAACVCAARTRGDLSGDEQRIRRVTALLGGALTVAYLASVRLPALREGWSRERLLSELGGLASSTTWGLPLVALAVLLGLTGLSMVIGETLERGIELGLARSTIPNANAWARRARRVLTAIAFLVGSSAVLRYATGSPWPLAG